MNSANWMGVPGAGRAARCSICLITASSFSSVCMSLLILATISSGVRAGAASPDQPAALKPGMVAAINGILSSGAGAGRAVVTASALMRPSLMWFSADAVLSIISFTCPPSRSAIAGPLPL